MAWFKGKNEEEAIKLGYNATSDKNADKHQKPR